MLTPEQKKLVRDAWLAKHPDYYHKGGKGYEIITRKVICDCGKITTADHLKRHQRSKIHKRLMESKVSGKNVS